MKVAIIGAGISGLTAARKLSDLGIHVEVFEKSKGLGGRLSTKRLEWGHVDIGAQYFTARDPRFKTQVNEWVNTGDAALWNLEPHIYKGEQLSPSPDSTQRYVGMPSMNSIAHALAKNITIRFEIQVSTVSQVEHGWQIATSTQDQVTPVFDWVVVTAPSDQSRALLSGTSLEHQIPTSIYHPCWAVALATKGQVPSYIQGIFGDETISWITRLSSRPNRKTFKHCDDCWMLHFSAEWTQQHPKNTPINISEVGLHHLNKALEQHISEPLKAVDEYHHFWRYARVKKDSIQPGPLIDDKNQIAVIGDWVHGGRVEGAYLSALDFVDSLDI